jgi:hypothetical protein
MPDHTINNWYKIIRKKSVIFKGDSPFLDIWVKGFEELPKDLQEFLLGFSIASKKENEMVIITMCDVDLNDKQILSIFYAEFAENNFQRI